MAASPRDLATHVLRRVERDGAFAAPLLRAELAKCPEMPPADRALATELVYGVLRHRRHLDLALQSASGRRLKDLPPPTHALLRVGAYQLLFLDRVPDYAAVNEAVRSAQRAMPKFRGRVNAILRRLSEDPDAARQRWQTGDTPAIALANRYSLSVAVATALLDALGPDGAAEVGRAALESAPRTLRVNRLRADRAAVAESCDGAPGDHPDAVIVPPHRGLLADLEVVQQGLATPQDESSMRVVDVLAPEAGERILDLCAAPGGKTGHIAERMGDTGEVHAHDRLPAKLDRIRAQAERLGLASIQVQKACPRPPTVFDRVLVDAPCAGLGTLPRHPEIRWKFRLEDLDELHKKQCELLYTGWTLLRPGGVLVYSLCSFTRREAEDVLAATELDRHVQFSARMGHAGAPPTAGDGFFVAKLVKP